MMSKYNKQFKYKGYTFNTSVELNTRQERHPGGASYHTVITNDMGPANFYIKDEVSEDKLEYTIINHKYQAEIYVDKREVKIKTPTEQILSDMGFEK